MTYLRKRDHTNDTFKILRILKYDDVNTYISAMYVFKSINNLVVNNCFSFRSNERYSLRNSTLLTSPLMRSSQSQSSINFHGVKVWNSLPSNLRNIVTVTGFKRCLKQYLLSRYQTSSMYSIVHVFINHISVFLFIVIIVFILPKNIRIWMQSIYIANKLFVHSV